jgi:PAS domain-containing protein
MKKMIKILHLEDSVKDSEIIRSMIESSEIECEYYLTDNRKDFNDILKKENIDLILSDFSLPDFNGNEALMLSKEQYSHIPFIFVSGKIGEDAAINALVNGATDYVFKNKLERLVPAINRALHECEIELKRKLAEEKLLENQEMFHKARILAKLGIWSWKADNDIVTWTEELYQIAGIDPKLAAPTYAEHSSIYTPQSWHLLKTAVENAMKTGEVYELELELIRPDDSIRNVIAFGGVRFDNNGKIDGLYGTVQDITERKRSEQELIKVNKELAFQNVEKEKRAHELIIANKELAFQTSEKEKRADELIIADIELVYQNTEKENRAAELIIADKELGFQKEEKEKRADELIIANKELVYQNALKEKRAEELVIANKELHFQNEEKEKRAAELIIANKELQFQNEEKEKRANELIIANKELAFQNEEKEKRAAELIIANEELAYQNEEKEKRANELIIAKEKAEESERKFRNYIANAPDGIFIVDETGHYLEINKAASQITGYSEEEILSMSIKDLISQESLEIAVNHFVQVVSTGFASSEFLL